MKNFDMSIHGMRAFTILCIAMLHCVTPLWMKNPVKAEVLVLVKYALLGASSGIFAFISGYLFYHLEKSKIKDSDILFYCMNFWKKKIQNIYFPMIFTSVVILVLFNYIFKVDFSAWKVADPCVLPETISESIVYILAGGVQSIFWYIPFCLACFIISPFLLKYYEEKLVMFFILTAVIPFFIGRNALGFSYYSKEGYIVFVHLFLWHFPFFIFGMILSKYRYLIISHVKFNIISLLCIFIFLELVIFTVMFWFSNMRFFDNVVHSFIYLKIMVEIPLLYVLFEKMKKRTCCMDMLAAYSFSIYFWHEIVMEMVSMMVVPVVGSLPLFKSSFWCLFFSLSLVAVTIAVIIGTGVLCRKIFGKYSRWMIGA